VHGQFSVPRSGTGRASVQPSRNELRLKRLEHLKCEIFVQKFEKKKKVENFACYNLVNGKNLTLFLLGFFQGFNNLPSYEGNLCIQKTLYFIYTQYYGSYK